MENNESLVYLQVAELYPHPENPRKDLGDLSELTASIKENGILQNLTVVKGHDGKEDGYTVVIGHRRRAAAIEAGLEVVPCIIAEMTPKEQIQTMLLENMQRSDLKIYEEANGLQMLLDFGDSIETVAQKTGFSEATIRRRTKLKELNQKKLKEVVDTRQISLTDLNELSKVEDVKARNKLLADIGTRDFNYKLTGELRKQAVNKNMQDVKDFVKKIDAKQIPAEKKYTNQYEDIGGWNNYDIENWEESKKKIPDLKGEVFYDIEASGKLKLYRKAQKEKKQKKTPEEIERNRKIKGAWEYLDEQAKVLYAMRKDFIEKLSVTTKNKCGVLKGALIAGIYSMFVYNQLDTAETTKLLGLEDQYDKERLSKSLDACNKMDNKKMARLIWNMFGDSEKTMPTGTTFRKAWPEYTKNHKAIYLYDWLTSIGYVMSEAEEKLIYGQDEIYVDPDKPAQKAGE